jgi:hypothetical protein
MTGVTGITIGATTGNTSGITGGGALSVNGAGYSQSVTAPNGTSTVYFTVGGIPAGVSITASGAAAKTLPFEGVSTGQVYQVNTGDIAALGGTKTVTLTAKEEGKEAVTITVTVNVAFPAGTTLVEVSSIAAMASELAGKPANSVTTPYLVKLDSSVNFGSAGVSGTVTTTQKGTEADPLAGLFDAAQGKYIILDLSGIDKDGGSTTIPDRPDSLPFLAVQPNDFIVQVILPDWVTEIGDFAFYQKTNLAAINLPDSITKIGTYAFNETGITSLKLPDSITSVGSGAFQNCTELAYIDCSNWHDGITFGIRVFQGCTELTSLDFSACTELTQIGGMTNTGAYLFQDCINLDTIQWPPNIKTVVGAPFSNTGFVTIDVPDTVESFGISSCAELVWIRWLSSPASAPLFGNTGCPLLRKIVLPVGVNLDKSTFCYVTLKTLVLYSTTPYTQINFRTFEDTPNIKIYVPDTAVNTYKNANQWQAYWADKVYPYSELTDKPENWVAP